MLLRGSHELQRRNVPISFLLERILERTRDQNITHFLGSALPNTLKAEMVMKVKPCDIGGWGLNQNLLDLKCIVERALSLPTA